MVTPGAVTIVVNGSIVASVMSSRIAAGRVFAPLAPIVVRLASGVSYDAVAATITIERNGLRIVVPAAFVENDMPFVELGPVVRRLGGRAAFDNRTKTLAITLRAAFPIATPAPFEGASPQAEPTTIFTPAPPLPTPRAIVSGLPRPRRTAIPVIPSQPVLPPAAESRPINPRR
jgi:hypothetical protein